MSKIARGLAALIATLCAFAVAIPTQAASPAALRSVFLSLKPVVPGLVAGPWFDSGICPPGTASATINGRSINGRTWIGNAGAVTNVDSIFTSSLCSSTFGTFSGTHGSNTNSVYMYVNVPSSNQKWWVTRRLSTAATAAFIGQADFLTTPGCCVSNTNIWSKLEWEQSALSPGSVSPGYINAAAASSGNTSLGVNSSNITPAPGDTMQTRYDTAAGTADTVFNGQVIKSASVITGPGIPLTNTNFGFRGNVPSNQGGFSYFQIGDPDAQALITLISPAHTAPVDANGDLTRHFRGEYNTAVPAPTSATYTMYDTAQPPTVVASGSVVNFSASGGIWTGDAAKVVSASIPAGGFWWEACRPTTGGTPNSCWQSPTQTAGVNIGFMGQSIWTNNYPFNANAAFSFGTNKARQVSATIDLATCSCLLDLRASNVPTATNAVPGGSVMAPFVIGYQAGTGNTNLQIVLGGKGGTTAYERAQIGSTARTYFTEGINLAGGDLAEIEDSSGTFDADGRTSCGGSCITAYAASQDTFYSFYEGMVGHTIPVNLLILGTTQGVTSGSGNIPGYDTFRRVQYNMSVAGGRYCLGVGLADITHNAGDQYHYTREGAVEESRRAALMSLNCKLGGTTYKRGLQLNSATLIDPQTVDVLVDAPNAIAVLLTNTTNATYGPNQGFTFGKWNGSTLTGAIGSVNATGVSLQGSFSSSQQTLRFTFPAGTFTGLHAAVSGPRGPNPFNPLDTTGDTINNSGSVNKDYWADGMAAAMAVYPATATISGTISSNVLTGTVATGTLHVGDWLKDPNSTRSFLITTFGTGTGATGNTGTYNLLAAANQASTTTFTAAEPMQPIQTYFKTGGATTGADDFVITP